MIERGLMMVLHSVVIGVVLYMLMVFVFNQNPKMAEYRSILVAAALLIYMILFGHGLPTRLNKDL
jgi:DMSO reductase anchor subunit